MKGLPFGGTASMASFLRMSRASDLVKDLGFRPVFSALGVEFDLRGVSQGVLRIGNTEKRKAELKLMFEKHLAEGSMTPGESESLPSRLMFAESQLFGRTARLALRAIGGPALPGQVCKPLTDEVRFGLTWMLLRLVEAPPPCEVRAQEQDTLFLSLVELGNLLQTVTLNL